MSSVTELDVTRPHDRGQGLSTANRRRPLATGGWLLGLHPPEPAVGRLDSASESPGCSEVCGDTPRLEQGRARPRRSRRTGRSRQMTARNSCASTVRSTWTSRPSASITSRERTVDAIDPERWSVPWALTDTEPPTVRMSTPCIEETTGPSGGGIPAPGPTSRPLPPSTCGGPRRSTDRKSRACRWRARVV